MESIYVELKDYENAYRYGSINGNISDSLSSLLKKEELQLLEIENDQTNCPNKRLSIESFHLCCVSIGIEKDGQMILGAVYNPFMNEFFFTERGKGATLNDKPIRVSEQNQMIKACLVTGFPYTYLDAVNGPLDVFERFIRKGVPVRRLGSAAIDLCWVAAGRFDGFYEHKLQAWDSAAGFLMVEEAGGTITDFEGNYYSPYQPHLVATNGKIHQNLLDIVNNRKTLE